MPVEHLNRRRPGDPSARARLAEAVWAAVAHLDHIVKVAEEYECLDIRDALAARSADLYSLGDKIEGGDPLPEAAMLPGDLPPA